MSTLRTFTKKQDIFNKPQRILVGQYTTKSGDVKNRYITDPTAKVIKTITHKQNHKRVN
jgi:hypothetical protein